jgi:hypothetical protein
VVVDHNRQHIGWRAVRTQQDKVIKVLVLPDDAALDLILDHRFAIERGAQMASPDEVIRERVIKERSRSPLLRRGLSTWEWVESLYYLAFFPFFIRM